jgi:hypothetical protein
MRLPKEYATKILERELLSDPTFKTFYNYILEQEMDFLRDESTVALYMPSIDEEDAVLSPTMLAIVPAAKPINTKASSHEVASIVAIRYGDAVGGVFATRAVVGLRPYKLTSFEIIETNEEGQLQHKAFNREQLENLSPEELANSLGPLRIDPTRVKPAGALSEENIRGLVSVLYQELLKYSFDRGIYPPEALNSLLEDMQISQKWSLAQSMRKAGGSGHFGCSTSSSCFGCTSTSCSWVRSAT